MMLVNEVFPAVQGEGSTIGKASLFIRLTGCNMKPICSWCDTKYALKEGKEYSVDEVIDMIEKQPLTNIVITGGDGLICQDEIVELIFKLIYSSNDDILYTFEIETNGLILPHNYLMDEPNVMFNVSPKRQNFDMNVLEKFHDGYTNFKFVIENDDDFKFWSKEVIKKLDLDPDEVFLMPEGINSEKIKKGCKRIVEKYCLKYGYNLSPRLHVILWENERGK